MAHLTNLSFEFVYEIFTEDASLLLLYHGAKKSKMTKNSNQGGGGSCTILLGGLLHVPKVTHGFFLLLRSTVQNRMFVDFGRFNTS